MNPKRRAPAGSFDSVDRFRPADVTSIRSPAIPPKGADSSPDVCAPVPRIGTLILAGLALGVRFFNDQLRSHAERWHPPKRR
jgi:hypothetical protein